MKILVVEDEKKISDFIRKGLEEQGFTVETSTNGDDAFQTLSFQTFDVVVLDIMLPGRDGLSILRSLRKQKNPIPVILLTARTEPYERVEGLNLGADDYLTKPFYIDELIARIHAVSRRSTGDQLSVFQVSDLTVNMITRQVKRANREIDLTGREFSLLEVLVRSPKRVFTRTQLLERVWGYDFDPHTNLVDVNIRRLRKKINEYSTEILIETVRGVGYRLL